MKFGAFIAIIDALTAMGDQPLPLEHAIPLAVFAKRSAPEVQTYQERRKAIDEAALLLDGEGKPVPGAIPGTHRLDPAKAETHRKALAALDAVEVAAEPPQVPLAALKAAGIHLSARHVGALLGVVLIEDAKPVATTPAPPPKAKGKL